MLLTAIIAFGATFGIYWILNPRIYRSEIRFRDWWRNRPTWRDPERWDRYERERGGRQCS